MRYKFRDKKSNRIREFILYGVGFVLFPIHALFMIYSSGTKEIFPYVIVMIFLITGLYGLLVVIRKRVEMYDYHLILYSGLRKRKIDYHDIKEIRYTHRVRRKNNSYRKKYFFTLIFKGFEEKEYEEAYFNEGGLVVLKDGKTQTAKSEDYAEELKDIKLDFSKAEFKIHNFKLSQDIGLNMIDNAKSKRNFLNLILKRNKDIELDEDIQSFLQ